MSLSRRMCGLKTTEFVQFSRDSNGNRDQLVRYKTYLSSSLY